MMKSRIRKRSAARTSLTALRRIEEAMVGLLGTDAYNERVRRYVAEHDAPADDRVAFERLCLTIFAQGLGFDTVERYRGALKSAFSDFVPEAVAAIDQQGLNALLHEPIIRNRSKIEACAANARQWAALARADGTYLARVARIAATDDPSAGWLDLLRILQQDFSRLGEATAGMTLKRWGFFMARAHPGARRLLQRLGFVQFEACSNEVQRFVATMAQAGSRDPYAVEAALALFASLGPCNVKPQCGNCVLSESCPVTKTLK